MYLRVTFSIRIHRGTTLVGNLEVTLWFLKICRQLILAKLSWNYAQTNQSVQLKFLALGLKAGRNPTLQVILAMIYLIISTSLLFSLTLKLLKSTSGARKSRKKLGEF